MRHFRFAPLVLCIGTLFCAGSHAQLNTWERTHPDGPDNNLGGFTSDLATSSDGVVYMRSGFGRYYTRSDSSALWENYTPTLNSQAFEPYNFYPHPTIAGQITGNTIEGLVLRSLDYGRTWSQLSMLSNVGISARSPIDPAVFYAGSFLGDSLYHSPDAGVSWSAIPLNDFAYIKDLELDATDANTMYALDASRIKKSTDGGFNWEVMEEGTGSLWFMDDLAIDPANSQKLFAASASSAYVFRTDDGAENWQFIGLPTIPGTGFPLEGIKFDPSNSNNVYSVGSKSSVHSSSDGGANWVQHLDGMGNSDWYGLTVSNTGDVVIGGTSGVGVLPSPGVLELSNQGFSDFRMKRIARTSSDPRFWYAGGSSGLVAYDVLNDQWALTPRPFDNNVRGIAVNTQNSEHVIVASFRDGLNESTDAGQTWQEIPMPVGGAFGLDIIMAPSNSNVLYVRSGNGLHRSGDGGSNWELVLDATSAFTTGGVTYPIRISPTNPDIVYVGTYDFGVYTTLDGGQTWKNTQGMFSDDSISDIATDPRNPGHVYASSYNGNLMQSTDSGDTWVEFDTSGTFGGIRAIALDSLVPGRIFMFSPFRLFIYEPIPQQWNLVGTGDVSRCNLDACQVLLDNTRQGYVTIQADGELYSLQRDYDADQLGDDVDNCTLISNPGQRDTDNDGYGNFCDADFNNDLIVNFVDIVEFANAYLSSDPNIDMNGDGTVNFVDLALFKEYFLKTPGPGVNGSP